MRSLKKRKEKEKEKLRNEFYDGITELPSTKRGCT
jgi:hypothetical protein